ncbi:MAG: hypothetical protein DCC58_12020 [Chloroflexi bacterium]|nr:MAG: hypothetical protein DCC58_12020 [Chloroflexota bacterium]
MLIVADPIMLVLPDVADGADAALEFVGRLIDWQNVVKIDGHSVVASERCVAALHETGRCPRTDSIHALLHAVGVHELDARTTFTLCNRILTNEPWLEDRLGTKGSITAFLVDAIDPDVLNRLRLLCGGSDKIADSLAETLVHVAYAARVQMTDDDIVFLTAPLAGYRDVATTAYLDTVEHGYMDIDTAIPLVSSPDDLWNLLEIQDVWRDPVLAIGWARDRQIAAGRIAAAALPAPYMIDPGFVDSIERARFHSDSGLLSMIYQAIAEVLCSPAGFPETHDNHHLMRNGAWPAAADASNRTWRAWRKWVRRARPAERLHYWLCDGRFVISKVGVHDDFTINPLPATAHEI